MKNWAILDPYTENPSDHCIQRLIERHQGTINFTNFVPSRGELPASENNFEGFVSLGSVAFATDHDTWILKLGEFLKSQLLLGKKVFGICFSHQLVAKQFGGVVDFNFEDHRSLKGEREITLAGDVLPFKKDEKIRLVYGQQQRVTAITEDFLNLGNSIYDYEILKHKSLKFLGTQAHPEASFELCDRDFDTHEVAVVKRVQSYGDKIIDHFILGS